MTAIFGLWSDGDQSVLEKAEAMGRALLAYGRDSSSLEVAPGVAIGAKRAHILPEDRASRDHDGHGRYLAQADARLTDRTGLLAQLGEVSFDELSDAELLIAALERWGTDAFDRIYGEFALVAWDKTERRIILARDVIGARPLFFHHDGNLFGCASMPEGLRALPGMRQMADAASYRRFLRLLNPAFGRTYFAGIGRVMPAHYLVFDGRSVKQHRYWHPSLAPLRLSSQSEYENRLSELLELSVAAALRGTQQGVAAHLSAGFDSTAVATTAARQLAPSGRKLVALTAAPALDASLPDAPAHLILDESQLASRTAELHENMEHVVVRRDRHLLENIDRTASIYPGPFLNLCNSVWCDAICDEVRNRGIRILLVGSYGNTTISESGTLALHELMRGLRFWTWWGIARGLVRNRTMRWSGVLWNSLSPWLPDFLYNWLMAKAGRHQVPIERYMLLEREAAEAAVREAESENERASRFDRQVVLTADRMKEASLDYRLMALTADHGSFDKAIWAEWGIERRDPTAERRLIEFALRVPVERLIWGGRPRAILRNVLADRAPAELLDSRCKGMQSADWAGSMHEAKAAIRDVAERLEISGAAGGMIAHTSLHQLLERWPACSSDDWHEPETEATYRFALLRAISASSHFNRANASNY